MNKYTHPAAGSPPTHTQSACLKARTSALSEMSHRKETMSGTYSILDVNHGHEISMSLCQQLWN